MTDNQTIFLEGFSYFEPRPNAPEYIKGSIVIDPKAFVAWMQANKEHLSTGRDREGQPAKVFRIDLKIGQSGKSYAALNTWQPSFQPKEEDNAW